MEFEDVCKLVMPLGKIGAEGIKLIGTCFLLNQDGLWATAAHVTENDDRGLVVVLPRINKTSEYQDTTDPTVKTAPVKIFKIDPIHDTAILRADAQGHSNLVISTLDRVKVGDQMAIFGFPHADHGRMVLTYQPVEIGAKILLDSSGIKTKHVVLNVQTRPGQSGSPVINLRNMELVAILIGSYAPGGGGGISLGGVDPHTLHQTTHAVSAEYLGGMI